MMNSIKWPEKYLPGTTDNFASNEVIVKGLTVADVWPYRTPDGSHHVPKRPLAELILKEIY